MIYWFESSFRSSAYLATDAIGVGLWLRASRLYGYEVDLSCFSGAGFAFCGGASGRGMV